MKFVSIRDSANRVTVYIQIKEEKLAFANCDENARGVRMQSSGAPSNSKS
jgi:hypothetical protein